MTDAVAGDAAAGWGGGSYELWTAGASRNALVLGWAWDTALDARQFDRALRDVRGEAARRSGDGDERLARLDDHAGDRPGRRYCCAAGARRRGKSLAQISANTAIATGSDTTWSTAMPTSPAVESTRERSEGDPA